MTSTSGAEIAGPAHLHSLRLQNFGVFEDLQLGDLTPFTVLVGPNGSGKSTVLDALAFLHECFSDGLRRACERRGGFNEVRSRGANTPVTIDLKFQPDPGAPLLSYHLAFDEGPVVAEEHLEWEEPGDIRISYINFRQGEGTIVDVHQPGEEVRSAHERLDSPDLIAASVFGQVSRFTRTGALRRFILGWNLLDFSPEAPGEGAVEQSDSHLDKRAANLAGALHFLEKNQPDRLARIEAALAESVPGSMGVRTARRPDGRLTLQMPAQGAGRPFDTAAISHGTLALIAHLIALTDPSPPPLIGVEEPERHLHPTLLYPLAERCRLATEQSQIIATTHSPLFVDALRPEELWLLYRTAGVARGIRSDHIQRVRDHVSAGALLGQLWTEDYLSPPHPDAPSAPTGT